LKTTLQVEPVRGVGEMQEWMVARSGVLATAGGAELIVTAGPVLNPQDQELRLLAEALGERAAAASIRLTALWREEDRLHVVLDDEQADEPLTPGALDRTVRQIAWQLFGRVWEAVLHETAEQVLPKTVAIPSFPGAAA
jgi:hypothetical protein